MTKMIPEVILCLNTWAFIASWKVCVIIPLPWTHWKRAHQRQYFLACNQELHATKLLTFLILTSWVLIRRRWSGHLWFVPGKWNSLHTTVGMPLSKAIIPQLSSRSVQFPTVKKKKYSQVWEHGLWVGWCSANMIFFSSQIELELHSLFL